MAADRQPIRSYTSATSASASTLVTIRSLSGHFIQLGLQRVVVVYPGDKRYPIADRVEAVPIDALVEPGQLFSAEAGA